MQIDEARGKHLVLSIDCSTRPCLVQRIDMALRLFALRLARGSLAGVGDLDDSSVADSDFPVESRTSAAIDDVCVGDEKIKHCLPHFDEEDEEVHDASGN